MKVFFQLQLPIVHLEYLQPLITLHPAQKHNLCRVSSRRRRTSVRLFFRTTPIVVLAKPQPCLRALLSLLPTPSGEPHRLSNDVPTGTRKINEILTLPSRAASTHYTHGCVRMAYYCELAVCRGASFNFSSEGYGAVP